MSKNVPSKQEQNATSSDSVKEWCHIENRLLEQEYARVFPFCLPNMGKEWLQVRQGSKKKTP